MPRIDVPDGPEHITERIYALQPAYAEPAGQLLNASVYQSLLPLRIREGVRFRIAQINGCLICQSSQLPDVTPDCFDEADYAAVSTFALSDRFTVQEKLALAFAEKFALDHESLDDAFFGDLHRHFCDAEILDLAIFTGRFLAFGRITHVLGLDDTCSLPLLSGVSEY